MVKKGNTRVIITLDPKDIKDLEYLKIKLGLNNTQLYRLAIRLLAHKERTEE